MNPEYLGISIVLISACFFVWFFAISAMEIIRVYYNLKAKYLEKQKRDEFWLNVYTEDGE